jgi:hypothetical protein
MKPLRSAVIVIVLYLAVSCSGFRGRQEDTGTLTGIWVGDFGPAFYDRNTISLELHWDEKELTGLIRPGVQGGRMYRNFDAFPIENSSYDPATGKFRFEATYKPRNRRYIIEGEFKNGAITGTWKRPDDNRDGDFKLSRQKGS